MSARKNGLRAGFASLAAVGLAVAGAGVASATTITPAGEGVTATGTGSPALSLAVPGFSLDCFTFEAKGQTPTSGDSVILGGNDVTIGDCFLNYTYPVTVDVHEDVTLVVDYNGGNPQGSLVVPDGGMTASYSQGGATCALAVNASTVGPVAYDNNTGIANAVSQSGLNYTSTQTGSIACPASGTALVTTALQLELDGGGNPVVGP